jgi:DNA recombination protein RmuC
VRNAARDIQQKYIAPPHSTDFAILFLPTEGLYAEILRQPGLHEQLQREHRVLVTGPTTFAALLNSLRMGFRTLAIEKRSSEVWRILSAVKTEFGKFGAMLDRAQKQVEAVGKTLGETALRNRQMARRLQSVETLPDTEAQAVLALPEAVAADEGESAAPGAGS